MNGPYFEYTEQRAKTKGGTRAREKSSRKAIMKRLFRVVKRLMWHIEMIYLGRICLNIDNYMCTCGCGRYNHCNKPGCPHCDIEKTEEVQWVLYLD